MADISNEQREQHVNGGGDPDTTLDLLWEQSYVIHYDTLFQEIRYEILLKWLKVADTSSAWIVAVTVTGTGIGGWALWGTEVGKYIWGSIASVASLVSITHAVLRIADHQKHHMEVFRTLRALRRRIESFRQSIRRDQIVPTPEKIQEAEGKYLTLRDAFEKIDSEVAPSGVLDAREEHVQDEVDNRLKKGGWV